ncbi:MAG: FecR family protein, partial [Chitinophagaceae bacterium]|nr:FecR family protein [Chitinophagaceae bacterium]
MELSENRYKELAQKWAEGRISPEEAREYLDWYNTEDNSPLEIAPEFATSKEELEQRMLATIQQRVSTKVPVIAIRRRWTRYVAAAAILVMIASGSWFFLRQNTDQPDFPVARVQDPYFKNDVLPGGDGAVLTLADGKQIVLDAHATGQVAREGNTVLLGSAGELRYAGTTTETLYNTLTTRKGQQYTLALSDGTKVWLNAGSSIRYPVGFTGDTRVVEITGEAYFEVASQPLAQSGKKPFIVKVNDMEVTVLGTHFNINSYGDEGAIRTTWTGA